MCWGGCDERHRPCRFGLYDGNIHPEQMLTMPYVRLHIRNYLGGVLAEEEFGTFPALSTGKSNFFETDIKIEN